MTKKPNPIAEHKESDISGLRLFCLNTLDATAKVKCPHCQKTFDHKVVDTKMKIEAGKLLARLHKALQVDKTVINASAQAGAFAKQELTMPELKPEHKEKLAKLLHAQPS